MSKGRFHFLEGFILGFPLSHTIENEMEPLKGQIFYTFKNSFSQVAPTKHSVNRMDTEAEVSFKYKPRNERCFRCRDWKRARTQKIR